MMKNMTLAQTVRTQIPSGFAMPACGHAFGADLVVTATPDLTTGVIVRDRKASLKGGPRVTQAYFPGTSAWRPPTC